MRGQGKSQISVIIGDLVIIGNAMIKILAIVFLIIKLVLEIRRIYLFRKSEFFVPKGAWLQLIVIYIQQGAMGFEELLNDQLRTVGKDSKLEENPIATDRRAKVLPGLKDYGIKLEVDSPVKRFLAIESPSIANSLVISSQDLGQSTAPSTKNLLVSRIRLSRQISHEDEIVQKPIKASDFAGSLNSLDANTSPIKFSGGSNVLMARNEEPSHSALRKHIQDQPSSSRNSILEESSTVDKAGSRLNLMKASRFKKWARSNQGSDNDVEG